VPKNLRVKFAWIKKRLSVTSVKLVPHFSKNEMLTLPHASRKVLEFLPKIKSNSGDIIQKKELKIWGASQNAERKIAISSKSLVLAL